MEGVAHDCGSKRGYIKAFVSYAMRNETYQAAIESVVTEAAK
jgi:UTP-glucose-1-phosphate uridylyltransferase